MQGPDPQSNPLFSPLLFSTHRTTPDFPRHTKHHRTHPTAVPSQVQSHPIPPTLKKSENSGLTNLLRESLATHPSESPLSYLLNLDRSNPPTYQRRAFSFTTLFPYIIPWVKAKKNSRDANSYFYSALQRPPPSSPIANIGLQ